MLRRIRWQFILMRKKCSWMVVAILFFMLGWCFWFTQSQPKQDSPEKYKETGNTETDNSPDGMAHAIKKSLAHLYHALGGPTVFILSGVIVVSVYFMWIIFRRPSQSNHGQGCFSRLRKWLTGKTKQRAKGDVEQGLTNGDPNLRTEVDTLKQQLGNVQREKRQLEEQHQRLLAENARKDAELEKLRNERRDMSNRLSKMASERMREGNPTVEDLNDPRRPTALVSRWTSLFRCGEYWTAYSNLASETGEAAAAPTLLTVCKVTYQTTKDYVRDLVEALTAELGLPGQPGSHSQTAAGADLQAKGLGRFFPDEAERESVLRSLRSQAPGLQSGQAGQPPKSGPVVTRLLKSRPPPPSLAQELEGVFRQKVDIDSSLVRSFADQLMELIYYMRAQEIPMVVDLGGFEGMAFDPSLYEPDNSSVVANPKNTVIKIIFRPPLLRHESGPVLSRGEVEVASHSSWRKEKSKDKGSKSVQDTDGQLSTTSDTTEKATSEASRHSTATEVRPLEGNHNQKLGPMNVTQTGEESLTDQAKAASNNEKSSDGRGLATGEDDERSPSVMCDNSLLVSTPEALSEEQVEKVGEETQKASIDVPTGDSSEDATEFDKPSAISTSNESDVQSLHKNAEPENNNDRTDDSRDSDLNTLPEGRENGTESNCPRKDPAGTDDSPATVTSIPSVVHNINEDVEAENIQERESPHTPPPPAGPAGHDPELAPRRAGGDSSHDPFGASHPEDHVTAHDKFPETDPPNQSVTRPRNVDDKSENGGQTEDNGTSSTTGGNLGQDPPSETKPSDSNPTESFPEASRPTGDPSMTDLGGPSDAQDQNAKAGAETAVSAGNKHAGSSTEESAGLDPASKTPSPSTPIDDAETKQENRTEALASFSQSCTSDGGETAAGTAVHNKNEDADVESVQKSESPHRAPPPAGPAAHNPESPPSPAEEGSSYDSSGASHPEDHIAGPGKLPEIDPTNQSVAQTPNVDDKSENGGRTEDKDTSSTTGGNLGQDPTSETKPSDSNLAESSPEASQPTGDPSKNRTSDVQDQNAEADAERAGPSGNDHAAPSSEGSTLSTQTLEVNLDTIEPAENGDTELPTDGSTAHGPASKLPPESDETTYDPTEASNPEESSGPEKPSDEQ